MKRRYRIQGADLRISWLNLTGHIKDAHARVIDVSENGMALLLPEPVSPGRIQFRSSRFKVNGIGDVRQCHREGNKYVAGLQFAHGVHWRAPDGDVQDPIPLCSLGA